MKKSLFSAAFLLVFSSLAFSQTITTASEFFKSVSDKYASVSDYEADLEIEAGKAKSTAHVSFKRPELVRIDYSDPAEQVIIFNGSDLQIYLPNSSAVLKQTVESSRSSAASIATPQGLTLLNRYYSVAYETGPSPLPLDEGSEEMVVNLVLYRRANSETFTSIKLSIDPSSLMIRRVIAYPASGDSFRFDFSNYKLNKGIPSERFIYDPPSSANEYNNFLFSE